MKDAGRPSPPTDCAAAREAIHARLDGDESTGAEALRQHLSICAECRAFEADLLAIGATLRAVPELEFPEEALQSVWRQTVDPPAAARRGAILRPLLAAAAMLTVTILGVWVLRQPVDPPSPTRAEVRQAAEEARMVLALTSRALRRVEHTAVQGVLAGEISPALNQIPVRWPASPAPTSSQPKGTGS